MSLARLNTNVLLGVQQMNEDRVLEYFALSTSVKIWIEETLSIRLSNDLFAELR